MMDWEQYDLETEQESKRLWTIDTNNPEFDPWNDCSASTIYELTREIDKQIIKDLIAIAEREIGKRLKYKHNKKRKFKKWNNKKTKVLR
jgi:hypothetical protein